MATAQVNGIDIRYEDSGGDGPAVVFSHGFLMNHTMFDAQVAALAGDYRCIRWDERGFGGTTATGSFTYWDSADDAVGLLDYLSIDRAVFVGMSQGGFLSMRAALAHPDRVRAIALIDSSADLDDDEFNESNQAMMHVFEHGSDEEKLAVWQIVAGMILGDEALAAEWIPTWAQIDIEQLGHAAETLIGRDDIMGRVGQIGCPVLSIHGTDDAAISMDRAEALAAALPDSRGLVKVDGAAHAPNMTHPEVVNPALAEFLASL
jgi:pimeloyl-ACP methyl ester carboxylesterase